MTIEPPNRVPHTYLDRTDPDEPLDETPGWYDADEQPVANWFARAHAEQREEEVSGEVPVTCPGCGEVNIENFDEVGELVPLDCRHCGLELSFGVRCVSIETKVRSEKDEEVHGVPEGEISDN